MVKKAKKQRVPSIVAPRLSPLAQTLGEMERLLHDHEAGQLDEWQIAPRLRELATEAGTRRIFEELVNRLHSPQGEVRPAVLRALGILGGGQALLWLWEIVRTPHKSLPARSSAMAAIEKLGGKVSVDQLPEDLIAKLYGSLGSLGKTLEDIAEAETAWDVELAVLPLLYLIQHGAGDEDDLGPSKNSMLELIERVARRSANQAGADLLQALAVLATDAEVRREAERGLLQLRGLRVQPAAPGILALRQQRFYRAYSGTLPRQREQERMGLQLIVSWQRGDGTVSPLVFVLQYEQGATILAGVDLLEDMAEQEFRRRYVEQAWLAGTPLLEMSLAEARDLVQQSIETSGHFGLPLPPGYEVLQPIVERRLLQADAR